MNELTEIRQGEVQAKEEKKRFDFLGTALAVGVGATAGAMAGAAEFFYEYSLVAKRPEPKPIDDPVWAPYEEGRRWVNTHVLRRDVYVTAQDGLSLHGHFIPAPDPACHRYAILVHGYQDRGDGMGIFARHYYVEHGMNVLLPDLRGHGASEGGYIGMGYPDSRDILRWIRFVVERDKDAVIVLHGISMGAATVLLTSGHGLPYQVKAVVSDCAYSAAFTEMKHVYRTLKTAVFPTEPLMEMVRGLCYLRCGYDLKKACPKDAVARSKTPTLFLHGDSDDFVPSSMMPELFEAAACPKEFAWFAGAGHAGSVIVDEEGFWETIDAFLDRVSPWILNDNIKAEE